MAMGPLTNLAPRDDGAGLDDPVQPLRCDMDLMVDKKPDPRDDSPAAELGRAGEPVAKEGGGGGEDGGTAAFLADAEALAVAGRIGCSETSLVSFKYRS